VIAIDIWGNEVGFDLVSPIPEPVSFAALVALAAGTAVLAGRRRRS